MRLEQAMALRGLSPAELARRTAIDRSTISRYLSGERSPRFDHLLSMAKVLRVSLDYLVGEDVDRPAPSVADILDQLVLDTKKRLGIPSIKEDSLTEYSDKGLPPIPVIGKVSEGEALIFDQQGFPTGSADHTIPRAGDDDPNAYGVIVDDDSMEPVIQPAWEVVAGPNAEWHSGELAILRLKSGAMKVRRTLDRGQTLLLQPYNTAHEPEVVAKSDVLFIHKLISIRPK